MGRGRQRNVCKPRWKAITIHGSRTHLAVQLYESKILNDMNQTLKDVMSMFQMSEMDSPFQI